MRTADRLSHPAVARKRVPAPPRRNRPRIVPYAQPDRQPRLRHALVCEELLAALKRGDGVAELVAARPLLRMLRRLLIVLEDAARAAEPAHRTDVRGGMRFLCRRHRQVMDALLKGDSEKQVAAKLKISRNTVHTYVKQLYLRFGVSSRAELLATMIGK